MIQMTNLYLVRCKFLPKLSVWNDYFYCSSMLMTYGVFLTKNLKSITVLQLLSFKSRLAYGVFLWYNIVKKKVSVLLCLTETSHVKRHHGMD